MKITEGISKIIKQAEYVLNLSGEDIRLEIKAARSGGNSFSLGKYDIEDFEQDKYYLSVYNKIVYY